MHYIECLTKMRNEVQKRDEIDVDDFVQLCDLLISREQKMVPSCESPIDLSKAAIGSKWQRRDGKCMTLFERYDNGNLRFNYPEIYTPHGQCGQTSLDIVGPWTKQPSLLGIDQDGCCKRCGMPLEDASLTEEPHVCALGFASRATVAHTNRGRIETALRKLGVVSANILDHTDKSVFHRSMRDLAADLSPLLDTSSQQRVAALENIATRARFIFEGHPRGSRDLEFPALFEALLSLDQQEKK